MNITLFLLAIYFLIVIGIGFYSRRKAKSGSAFIIASHKAGFWRVSASLFTLLGGGELVTMASLSYTYSYAAMWFFGGVAIGFLTLAIVVPRIRTDENLSQYTGLADFFHERFGQGAGLSAACLIIIAFFALLMIQFSVGGSLLVAFLGWPYPVVVLCMSAVIVIYLSMGGYEAVLSTDVMQAIVMISFAVVILFVLPSTAASTAPIAMPAIDSLVFLSTGWLAVIASADIWQIVFASKSVWVARGGLIMAAVGFSVFGLFLSHLGNITRNVYPSLASPDEAFNTAIANIIPPAFLPFGIIFVFAAVMSTADTEIFVVTRTIVREFRRRASKGVNEDAEKGLTIAGTSYVAIAGALLAILVREQLQLVYFTLVALVVALSPSMIGYWFFRPSSKAVMISILIAPVSLLVAFFLGQLSPVSAPFIAFFSSTVGLAIGSAFTTRNRTEVNPTEAAE